ncbi:two-component sensor histidine kinase [Actinopolyspora mortivallis]|uniref:histidine kinase n=1 Tax=Actinopolyspora mortivallis TaxID=33906 RepID=A0A2T0H167_ACTMO|nr:two-component sensor histidine kinase [Actinopolyspora mortivallis]
MPVDASRSGNPGSVTGTVRRFTRVAPRAVLLDAGLVLAFATCHVLVVLLTPHEREPLWWWSLLVALPAHCSLLVRRHLPWVSLLVLLAVTILLTWLGEPVGSLNLAILVSVYSVCVRGGLVATLVAGALAMVWPLSKLPLMSSAGAATVMLSGALVNLTMILGWGRSMRIKRDQAAQLEQAVQLLDEAREQLAEESATVERARIAREFHDIVSHNLSVVALRAGVARSLLDRDPDHARDTLRELEQISRSSLEQMRQLLGALRTAPEVSADRDVSPEAAERAVRRPAPGLAQVDELIDSVRGTGVNWRLERCGQVRELGPGVETTAYRIVQEAVTNVLKHAGSGYARVLLKYQRDQLAIEVSNHRTSPPSENGALLSGWQSGAEAISSTEDRQASGHGLVGLRERVSLFGGALTAHPVPNGFHLSAVLPCPETSDPVRAEEVRGR